jgi:hypothetical protein
MSVTEYTKKFLQLLRFGMYLILNKEKKAKKFERGLNSRIWIMMSWFDIRDFSQLMDWALIYEESLKENAAEYTDQKIRTQGLGTSAVGARPAKRMAVGSFHPKGHKDIPSVTLQLCHRRVRYQRCVKSVIEFAKDTVEWQTGLATGGANSVTSARTVWAREKPRSLWHQLEFTCLF